MVSIINPWKANIIFVIFTWFTKIEEPTLSIWSSSSDYWLNNTDLNISKTNITSNQLMLSVLRDLDRNLLKRRRKNLLIYHYKIICLNAWRMRTRRRHSPSLIRFKSSTTVETKKMTVKDLAVKPVLAKDTNLFRNSPWGPERWQLK